jgi:hypothetical protein
MNDVYDRENIMLDRSKIEKNPGKRALAKLMLNSFWGKVSYFYIIVLYSFNILFFMYITQYFLLFSFFFSLASETT